MARFSNLEYDDSEESGQPENPRQPLATKASAKYEPRERRDEEAYTDKALAQYQLGQFEQALRLYSRALEFNPNHEPAWVGQVRMLLELGELKEAAVWSQKSLDIFRNHPELLSARAVAACRLGDREKALQFSDAAANAPNSNSVYVWLARGEVLLGTRGKNGQFCLNKAKTIAGGNDWFTMLLVARIYYFYRQYSRALEEARGAMELKPSNPFVWVVLGNSQERLGLFKQAKASYKQAIQLDRDYAPALKALANLHGLGFFKRFFPTFSRFF